MKISISPISLYSYCHAKRILVQMFAALVMLGANNVNAQTWEYLAYYTQGAHAGQASAPGYVTLNEEGGKPVIRIVAGTLNNCIQGDLDATITRTETTTIIVVTPSLRGCDEFRFVIKNDGTGGRAEGKHGTEWVWDGRERGLTLRK